jgi:hypothetical protein
MLRFSSEIQTGISHNERKEKQLTHLKWRDVPCALPSYLSNLNRKWMSYEYEKMDWRTLHILDNYKTVDIKFSAHDTFLE